MNETSNEPTPSAEVVRAGELVDSWGETLGALASRWGRDLLKGVALAREEMEDIWAEAQSRGHDRQA